MGEEDLQRGFLYAYEQYSDSIFRYAYFRLYDRELAKDLMQEAFLKTWQYISEGKKVDNFKAFLYQIVKNLIVSHVRKKKTTSLDQLMEKGFMPSNKETSKNQLNIEAEKVINAIGKLPQKYGEVVKLRYLEELSPKEISAITGQSENAVSVAVNRGLAKLRQFLNFKHEQ